MPTNNPLYAFINAHFAKTQTKINLYGYTIRKKQDLHHSNYFLIELDCSRAPDLIKTGTGSNVRTHQIDSAHISIFEQFSEVGFKSHYHVTLQFMDAITQVLGVNAHFYFDKDHVLIGKPTLKDLDETKGPARTPPTIAEYPQFTQLATHYAFPSIKRFVLQHKLNVAELTSEYVQALKNAYNDMFDNPTALDSNLELLNRAIVLLENLVAQEGEKHQKQLRHLKKISQAVNFVPSKETEVDDIIENNPDNHELLVVSPIQDTNVHNSKIGLIKPSIDKAQALKKASKKLAEFEKLYQDALQYKQRSQDVLSPEESCAIIKAWNKLNGSIFTRAEHIIDSYDMVDLSPDLLKKVSFGADILLKEYEAFCIKTLENLLTDNQFKLAESIKEFTALLPESMLERALQSELDDEINNHLIQFILQNSNARYPINTSFIHFKSGDAPALPLCIAFYLNKVNCFQMLLEDCKANALVIGRDGLPLAHTIMQLPTSSPFRQILMLSVAATPKDFFNKLILLITAKMKEADTTEADTQLYLAAISLYKDLAENGVGGVINARDRKELIPAVATITDLMPKGLLEKLNEREEYTSALRSIKQKTAYIAQLSKQTRSRMYEKMMKESLTVMIDSVTQIGADDALKLVFSHLLTADDYCKEMQRNIRILDKIVAILELMKTLGMHGNSKNLTLVNKTQVNDYNRLKQYQLEISELSEPSEKMQNLFGKASLRIKEKSEANYYSKINAAYLVVEQKKAQYLAAKINQLNVVQITREYKEAMYVFCLLTLDDFWAADEIRRIFTILKIIENDDKKAAELANRNTFFDTTLRTGPINQHPQVEELHDEYAGVDFVNTALGEDTSSGERAQFK